VVLPLIKGKACTCSVFNAGIPGYAWAYYKLL